jgi:hypothetical protein
MPLSDLIAAQLLEPFRIALLIGLVITMRRTRAATGTWLPLALGIGFVAVLMPSTLASYPAEPTWRPVVAGLVANSLIVAVILGAFRLFDRRGGPN